VLAGSLLVVYGATSCGVISSGSAAGGYAVKMAAAKCALPPLVAFGKGVGANWLVATAILQAATATTSAGKVRVPFRPS
jgi:formate/nitrite transporter FocA (FNT family)